MKNSRFASKLMALALAALLLTSAALAESTDDAALQARYDAALQLYEAGEYAEAYEAFTALEDFSDSRARAGDSRRQWKAATYKEAVSLYSQKKYAEAKPLFEALGNYEKSKSYLGTCTTQVMRSDYLRAKELYSNGEYAEAKELFESLGSFSDSRKRAQAADEKLLEQLKIEEGNQAYARGLELQAAGKLAEARDSFIQAGDHEGATEKVYETARELARRSAYAKALNEVHEGDVLSAVNWFVALGDYEDSAEQAEKAREAWQSAEYALAGENPDKAEALAQYLALGDYEDSAEQAAALKKSVTGAQLYYAAAALEEAGDPKAAQAGFEAASYEDASERAAQIAETLKNNATYIQAECARMVWDLDTSNALFESLGDFSNAAVMVMPEMEPITASQLRDNHTSDKSEVFTAPDGTKHQYQIFKGVPLWRQAQVFCELLGGHLATLTSAEENDFVYHFMRDSGYLTAFFGLSDEARTGDWIWVTGEPFDYVNWHRDEPSRSPRERYGMYFYKHLDGTWNDSHFYEHAKVDPGCSYICEWDLD